MLDGRAFFRLGGQAETRWGIRKQVSLPHLYPPLSGQVNSSSNEFLEHNKTQMGVEEVTVFSRKQQKALLLGLER